MAKSEKEVIKNISLMKYLEYEGIGAANSDCRLIDPKTGTVLKTVPAMLLDEPICEYMERYRSRRRR